MPNECRGRQLLIATFLASVLVASAPIVAGQTNLNSVEQAFMHATQLHEAGKLEAAISAYQAILVNHPKRADVRSNLGAAFSGLGRYEEAIDQYRQALALDHRNLTILFNLALAYYKAASFTEAARELDRFLAAVPQNFPQRPNAILLLADCQVRLGEYKKVIELLSPLLEIQPQDRTVAFLLGSAYVGDGQPSKGQALIDQIFRDEDSAQARLLMGSILLVADDGHGAIKEFERAIELDPKVPSLRTWYGRALMRMGDSDKAKTAFRNELADNPNDFEANLYLGILLRQDKLLEEAINYLSHAVRLRPKDQYARYHLGGAYAGLGKSNEARPLLEGVVKEFPEFIQARVLLASVYYKLDRKTDGDREQAVIQKLTAEQQEKQPGSQDGVYQSDPLKAPINLEQGPNRPEERR